MGYPTPALSNSVDQVRLLIVLPGLPGDTIINCNLTVHPFRDIKTAEALSYAWGSQDTARQNTISINGRPFHVGENLYQALAHLRSPAARRLLWIDALCINQSDTRERNHQVRLMASIYSGAFRVLVWLGLETTSSRDAFEFVRSAYERSPYNREELKDDTGWLALGELCDRPYWKRVWIIQEICLASRLVVCCGTTQMPWVYLSELRMCRKNIWPRYMSNGEQVFMRSSPARIDQQKASRDGDGTCNLWTLLEAFQASQCKEVHDKVYGFMGLSTDCGSTGIPIDYTRSVQQLYHDVMWFHYQKFRGRSAPPYAAQLMSLSGLLQRLLVCHSKVNLQGQLPQTVSGCEQKSGPKPAADAVVEVSAFSTLVIDKFLSSDNAEEYDATSLVRFLDGEIPYSHLGFWRDFIDRNVSGVEPINSPHARLIYHNRNMPLEDTCGAEPTVRSSVFIATPISRSSALGDNTKGPESKSVIGIAPPGCRRGDLVCTFVDSRVVLIARPRQTETQHVPGDTPYNHTPPVPRGRVFEPLVGRAIIDVSRSTFVPAFKSVSSLDKNIQISRVSNDVKELETPWPATLVIDLPSLQRLTSPVSGFPPMDSYYTPALDILPIRLRPSTTDQKFE